MVYVIQLAISRIRMELQFRPDPADRKLSANPYDTQQWYMSYRFADSLRSAGSGWASACFVTP